MKKTTSLVWRFFDRLEENKRCVAVLCKLCDTQYKYFGNTTNLRSHLVNKHPIQWELLQNGTLDDSTYRCYEDDESTNQTTATPKRRKYVKVYKNDNVRYSVTVDNKKHSGKSSEDGSMPVIEIQRIDVLENSETDNEHTPNEETQATINLVHQMHDSQNSDEEWLEDDWTHTVETYEPKHKKIKYRQIKREVKSPTPVKRTPSYIFNQKPSITKTLLQPGHSSTEGSPRKDEFSVFGEYIGNKLRKFKSHHTSANVQQLITTILWQAEYGVYDNMDAVKRVVLSTVQEMDVTQTLPQDDHMQSHDDKDHEIIQSGTETVIIAEG